MKLLSFKDDDLMLAKQKSFKIFKLETHESELKIMR